MKNFLTGLAAIIATGWAIWGYAVLYSHAPKLNDSDALIYPAWHWYDLIAAAPWVALALAIVIAVIWALGAKIRGDL